MSQTRDIVTHSADSISALLVEHGYSSECDHARVCGRCFTLFEDGRPDGRNQRCLCPDEAAAPDWPGYDVREHVRLCGCCGVVALRSGSRWSPFFCAPCRDLVMAATMAVGRLVFPIGRHSLMHTWVPSTPAPTLAAHGGDVDALARTVVSAVNTIGARQALVEAWAQRCVAENLSQLRLAHGVSLRDYLVAVLARPRPARLHVFAALCEFARNGGCSTSEVGSLASGDDAEPESPDTTSRQRIIYGSSPGGLVFLPEDTAAGYVALKRSRTWGEFKKAAPAFYEEVVEAIDDDEVVWSRKPIVLDDIPGLCDGDLIVPERDMLDFLPEDIQARYGQVGDTAFNGEGLWLDEAHEDAIVAALEDAGFECIKDQEAIDTIYE